MMVWQWPRFLLISYGRQVRPRTVYARLRKREITQKKKSHKTRSACTHQPIKAQILFLMQMQVIFQSIYIRRAIKNGICRHLIFLTPCSWDIDCPQNRTLGFCISVSELLPIRSTFYNTKNIIYITLHFHSTR